MAAGADLNDGEPCPSGSGLRFARTRDVDEQAALLRGWNQTYNQMSPGAFKGSILETDLGAIQIFPVIRFIRQGRCLGVRAPSAFPSA